MSASDFPTAVVFGAGLAGRRAARFFRRRYRLAAFADNDPAKWGTRFCGLPVLAAAEVAAGPFDKVLIASKYGFDIHDQLIDLGIPPERLEVVAPPVLAGEYELPWRCLGLLSLVLSALAALWW